MTSVSGSDGSGGVAADEFTAPCGHVQRVGKAFCTVCGKPTAQSNDNDAGKAAGTPKPDRAFDATQAIAAPVPAQQFAADPVANSDTLPRVQLPKAEPLKADPPKPQPAPAAATPTQAVQFPVVPSQSAPATTPPPVAPAAAQQPPQPAQPPQALQPTQAAQPGSLPDAPQPAWAPGQVWIPDNAWPSSSGQAPSGQSGWAPQQEPPGQALWQTPAQPGGPGEVPPAWAGGAGPTPPGGRSRWPVITGIVLAAIVLGCGAGAFVLVEHPFSHGTPNAIGSTTPPPSPGVSTTAPTTPTPTTTTPVPPPSTTTPAQTEQQAATSLSNLLSQSSSDRASIVAAYNDVSSCGSLLSQDQNTFQQAAQNRSSLLSQLAALPGMSSLPAGLVSSLTGAWQASESVDNDYAQWAGYESSNGCTPQDYTNSSYVAAEGPNQTATNDKTAFVSQWNSLAARYGLPSYQQNQI